MKRLVVVLALIGVVAGAHVAGSLVQRPLFRTAVNLVVVDVAVVRGRTPVAGLKAGNFVVFDNGTRQRVDRVLNEDLPLDASLVLDVSGSVRGERLARLKKAARGFVKALARRDRVGLVTFSHQVIVSQPLTTDREAVLGAIESMEAGGTTALYDAAYVALRLNQRAEDTRSVAVVLTDGADNASWLTAGRVVEAVERSETIVYGIALSPDVTRSVRSSTSSFDGAWYTSGSSVIGLRRYRFLQQIAEVAAGRVFDTSFSELDRTFSDILSDIRARYVLGYSPTDSTPGWHKLEVRLVGARGTVTARRGYWVTRRQTGRW